MVLTKITLIKKLIHRNFQPFANLFDVDYGDISLSVFYTGDVGSVEVCQMGKLFLRDSFGISELSDAVTNFCANIHQAKLRDCCKYVNGL